MISATLAVSLNCGDRDIYLKLMNREDESSTVLSPDLAIPHIILPGEKRFEVLLARAKKGIYFSEEYPNIKLIFVIAGSKDERQFHLQVLAAIAQIVQQPDFKDKWLAAPSINALRDIVLLADRTRH
jgi:mannitol/fructose-specific phosphotransferase system IIA component (Ntr-type)